jgi:hypothetical protein
MRLTIEGARIDAKQFRCCTGFCGRSGCDAWDPYSAGVNLVLPQGWRISEGREIRRNFTRFIQPHFPIHPIAEHTIPTLRNDGHKICAGLGIIASLPADRTLALIGTESTVAFAWVVCRCFFPP